METELLQTNGLTNDNFLLDGKKKKLKLASTILRIMYKTIYFRCQYHCHMYIYVNVSVTETLITLNTQSL